jgi:predicted transposase/invertase (TIGR01784 family)
MNDGSVNIFFNAKLYDKMNSVERRNFFEYLCKQKTESNFTENLANKVKSVKTSSDEKRVYMTFEEMVEIRHEEGFNEGKSVGLEEGIAQGMKKGQEEGAYNNKLETAKNLLKDNISPEAVVKYTGLSLETVLKLKKNL